MKRKINKISTLLITLIVLAVLSLAVPAQAQSSVGFIVNPSATNVDVADTFSVTVALDGPTQEINGVQLFMSYDPAVIEATSIAVEQAFVNVVIAPNFDNGTGTISYAAGNLGTSAQAPFDVITINFTALAEGVSPLAFEATTKAAFAGEEFTDTTDGSVTVGDGGVAPGEVLFRVNVGGLSLPADDGSQPDWGQDQGNFGTANNSPYLAANTTGNSTYNGNSGSAHPGAIDTTDPSIPPSAPDAMFNTERYDLGSAPEMLWQFPVPAGTEVEVRLYFAELFGTIDNPGERVFDVELEGNVPTAFDDIDQFAIAGAKGAFMRSATVTSDGTIDIEFIHGVENPALKGIEIVTADTGNPTNDPPVVTNPGEQTNVEGDVVSLQINATAPETGQTLNYSASGLPPSLTIDENTGLINGTLDESTLGTSGAAIEQGGMLIVEIESQPPGNWDDSSVHGDAVSGAIGTYYEWENGSSSGSIIQPNANNTISYPIQINNPGLYRFQWRSAAPNNTEHNDSWLSVTGAGSTAYGRQGNPSNPTSEVSLGNNFFKVYQNSSGNNWSWVANHVDNNAHQIYMEFDNAGLYTINISARSTLHKIDRFALYNLADFSNGQNNNLTSLPASPFTTGGDPGAAANSPYTVEVTVTDNGSPIESTTETFTWIVGEPGTVGDPSATVTVNNNAGLFASTFTNNSYLITNTGDVNITNVTFDLTTAFMQDIVYDPTGTAGDSGAKCLQINTGGNTGFINPGNLCVDPFSGPHNGVDGQDGWDAMTLTFGDFNSGETVGFSVDMDPTSIKGDQSTGDAGSVSGLEMIGTTVTIEFANGDVIVTSMVPQDPPTLGGSEALADSPLASPPTPSISIQGVPVTPTVVSDPNQVVLIDGPPNATIVLMRADARLYIDSGAPGGGTGYDIDPFEANEVLAAQFYTGTTNGNGQASINVTLTQTTSPNAGPDAGINHFIAAVLLPNGQSSLASNAVVLEYDPNANPALTFDTESQDIDVDEGATTSGSFTLTASDSSAPTGINLSSDQTWLTVQATTDAGVETTFNIDAANLSVGTYTATITADLTGYTSDVLTINLTVNEVGVPNAFVAINPGGGLGASTYGGSSYQITNNSTGAITIDSISYDLSTAILPDMVFDPVGSGGDATASCLTPNSGAATVGFVAPGDPCVDPFSVPRQGGFDVMDVNFSDFDSGEFFAFTVDIDPNSIQGVAGAGNAGAVSGYELIGATITVTFSDGSVITSSLYEEGSLGGSQAVVTTGATSAPTIADSFIGAGPATVSDNNRTITVTGTPGDYVSLLQMDSRLFIASGDPPFNVSDTTYYANEAMSGKALYTAQLDGTGAASIPVTLLQTSGGTTPDGGLNHFIAVTSATPYALDQQVSQTSNTLILKYDPNAANDADLTGSLTLQGRSNHNGPVTVSLYQNGVQVGTDYSVTTDSNGAFTITGIAPGTYEVMVKHPQYLASVETVTLASGSNSAAFGQQQAGDANNDNLVTALDFSLLSGAFNTQSGDATFNAAADFNGDGVVSALDFSLLSGNFNVAGETPTAP